VAVLITDLRPGILKLVLSSMVRTHFTVDDVGRDRGG
jgi:hypothetical protein